MNNEFIKFKYSIILYYNIDNDINNTKHTNNIYNNQSQTISDNNTVD